MQKQDLVSNIDFFLFCTAAMIVSILIYERDFAESGIVIGLPRRRER